MTTRIKIIFFSVLFVIVFSLLTLQSEVLLANQEITQKVNSLLSIPIFHGENINANQVLIENQQLFVEYFLSFALLFVVLIYLADKFLDQTFQNERVSISRILDKVTPLSIVIYVAFVLLVVFQRNFESLMDKINSWIVMKQFQHSWGTQLDALIRSNENKQLSNEYALTEKLFSLPHLSCWKLIEEFLLLTVLLFLTTFALLLFRQGRADSKRTQQQLAEIVA